MKINIQRFSYNNFVPEVWASKVEKDLEKDLVMANWCDYEYDGELELGKSVTVVGVNKPKVKKYTKGKKIDIENLEANSQELPITEADYFAYEVEDIDKFQSKPGFMEAQLGEAEEALAESAEKFVAEQAKNCNATMKSAQLDLSAAGINPLDSLNKAFVALYKNDVSAKTELAAELNPEHAMAVKDKLGDRFTNNNDYLKNSALGKYNNCYIRMTNCLYNDGTNDYEMVRTKKAIAFKNQMQKMKPSDNPYGFGEIVKGLHVYGAKLMRPKELYVILAKNKKVA